MCSITQQSHGSPAARLAALTVHAEQVAAEIADLVGDLDLVADVASIPGDAVASQGIALLAAADRATAAATVLVGHLDAGTGRGSGGLIRGRYASIVRF